MKSGNVLEVGRNPPVPTTVNTIDGCIVYPRIGSSFTPVTNCGMCPRVPFSYIHLKRFYKRQFHD